MTRILVDHDDIRTWAAAHAGSPTMCEQPVGTGTRALLSISFGQRLLNTGESQDIDVLGGWDLVSWEDWFAELDRQNLGIEVNDGPEEPLDSNFTFVPREAA